MDSVFLRENRGHLSETLSTRNYSFGARVRIIRRLPPNGSHPLRIPRNTRAQVKLAKSLAWPKEWGPCCVAFGRAFGSHPKGSGVRSSSGPPKMEIAAVKTAAISRLTTEIPQTDFCFDHRKGIPCFKGMPFLLVYYPAKSEGCLCRFPWF